MHDGDNAFFLLPTINYNQPRQNSNTPRNGACSLDSDRLSSVYPCSLKLQDTLPIPVQLHRQPSLNQDKLRTWLQQQTVTQRSLLWQTGMFRWLLANVVRASAHRPRSIREATKSNLELTYVMFNSCFWGSEKEYNKHMKGRLIKTEVGYTVRCSAPSRIVAFMPLTLCSLTYASGILHPMYFTSPTFLPSAIIVRSFFREELQKTHHTDKSVQALQDMPKLCELHSIPARVRNHRSLLEYCPSAY